MVLNVPREYNSSSLTTVEIQLVFFGCRHLVLQLSFKV